MSSSATIALVLFVVIDAAIAALIFWAAYNSLRPLREHCRPVPPALTAEHRRFQTFQIGMFGLGWSVHVALDRDYLHLTPIAPVRMLGAPEVSIPRKEIRIDRVKGRYAYARIRGVNVMGPEWCLRGPENT